MWYRYIFYFPNLASKAVCSPFVWVISKLFIVILSCFDVNNVSTAILVYLLSNAVCNPFVLPIVKLLSVIIFCFASKDACSPDVFDILNGFVVVF